MILDRLENWKSYYSSPAWTQAMNFIHGFDATAPDGEYPIQGRDIYAMIFNRRTIPAAESVLESHRVYADIQVLLSGLEIQARLERADLDVRTPYDPVRDVEFLHSAPLTSTLLVKPGQFVFYLPQDAHACLIQVGEKSELVRKLVVKVRADLL